METIFDYNPTQEEMRRYPQGFSKEEALGIDSDTNYYFLGLLFAIRNNHDKANEYFNRIKNKGLLGLLMQDF